MNILHVIVNNKVASYLKRDGDIVCGNSDYQIEFSFDDAWDAYTEKTARFIWNNQYTDIDFSGTTCPVPVITNTEAVRIGVYSGELSTTTPAIIGCRRSILCGDATPSVENDHRYANEAKEAAERAEAAADRAKGAESIPQQFLLTSNIWTNSILREDSNLPDGYYLDYCADRVMSDFINVTGQKCGKYIADLLESLFLLVYKFDADKKYIGMSAFLDHGDSVDINSDTSFIRILIGPVADGETIVASETTWMVGRLVAVWAFEESEMISETSKYTTAEYFRRKYNKLPVDPKMWSQRSLLYTGRYNAINTRISTMAIPFNYSRIKVVPNSEDYKLDFVFFDGEMTPIGNAGDWITSKTIVDVPEKTMYVAFCMARIDGDYIAEEVAETSPFKVIDISGVDAVDMKVMTYNIGMYNQGVRGGIPAEQLAEKITLYKQFFADSECDILAILEATTYMDEDNAVSAPETLFNPLYQGGWETYDGWSAFYGKMPLRNLGLFNFAGTSRAVICADVAYKGKDIHIVCAHLTPGAGEEATRASQMQELIDHLKTKDRFILFGDFNVESTSEFDTLKNAGYTNVNGGYLGWKKTYTSGEYYYDNIFVSEGIIVNKYDVPNVSENLTSDHLPLIANLTIL